MKKTILILLLCAVTVFSLCACGGETGKQTEKTVDANAPAHEQLLAQAENYLAAARDTEDMGFSLQGAYFYGQAQASVSALRYTVDYILYLMGEGDSLADMTAGAPYRNWDDITASGMGCPAPHYFEGLVLEIQGKTDEAQVCYDRAAANPVYEEMDFWYLRHMTTEQLYTLRKAVLEKEIEIFEEYTPRTVLRSTERTGAEFSPTYHLTLAAQAAADGEAILAWECARNALLVNPTLPELYATAAAYGITAKAAEAFDIINEGLLVFPKDGRLNYLAGAVALSAGENAAAQDFLTKAQTYGDADIAAMSQELLAHSGEGDAA